jgi:CubicO group peptidase (beta-lactamase class C family)
MARRPRPIWFRGCRRIFPFPALPFQNRVKARRGFHILFRSRTQIRIPIHLEKKLAIRLLPVLFLWAAVAGFAKETPPAGAVKMDLDAAAFSQWSDSLNSAGYRPLSLDLRGAPEKPLYTSSWIRSQGPAWKITALLDGKAFADTLAAWAELGFRPRAVAALEPRFAAIAEKDSTPARVTTDLDLARFQAEADSAQRNGWRCVWVDAYGTAAQPRLACVWKRNTNTANATGTAWNYSIGDDENSLHVKMDIFSRVWVRPAFLAPMPGGRILTLWEENSIGPWAAHADLAAEGAPDDLRREAAEALFPYVLQAWPGEAGARYCVLLTGRRNPLPRHWDVSGPASPGLGAFDAYMRALMQAGGVRAGSLAIAREGRLVFAHGYTWAEAGYPETRPNSLFRAASCSKPLTSIMVHQSLREGGGAAAQASGDRPSLGEKILALLHPLSDGGEAAEPADARFKDITVDQLLTHSGGWARSHRNPDPVFNDFAPGSEIRRRLPASRKDFLKYMLGQPLQFDPGSRSVYDNFGYFLLGRMLESLPMGAGKTYESLAGERLFRPLGLSRPRFGESRFEARDPGEVLYHTAVPYLQTNPEAGGSPWVPGGYGDFDLKNMDAAGAWILSAPDYAKVLAAFDLGADNPILTPEGVSTMWGSGDSKSGFLRGWFAQKVALENGDTAVAKWHNGLFPGTSTLVFHLPGRVSFVLFLNRDLSPQPGGREGVALSRLAEAVKTWPAADLFPEMGIPSFASATRTAAAPDAAAANASSSPH